MNESGDTCRLLLCEDSVTYAQALTQFLEHDPELRVAAHCLSGEETAESLPRVNPDLVIMDIELPGIDGVEATRRIVATQPVPVLVLSARTRRGSKLALAALEAGGMDVRSKDELTLEAPGGARAMAFRRYVKRLASPGIVARHEASGIAVSDRDRAASVVAVAASTGGAGALRTVLGALPVDFPVPIVVVQDLAYGFVDALIEWLDGEVTLPVRKLRDGMALGPGAWLGPDDAHVLVDEGLLARVDTELVAGYNRPAADLLFLSAASTAGAQTVAVALTGVRDGADGMAAVRGCGGLTIAQGQPAAVENGIAESVVDVGAEQVLPLTEIAPTLSRLSPVRPLTGPATP